MSQTEKQSVLVKCPQMSKMEYQGIKIYENKYIPEATAIFVNNKNEVLKIITEKPDIILFKLGRLKLSWKR